jgi:hypothetical protein
MPLLTAEETNKVLAGWETDSVTVEHAIANENCPFNHYVMMSAKKTTLDTGFGLCIKLPYCCGVINIDNWHWSFKSPSSVYSERLKFFIDYVRKCTDKNSLVPKAGAIITTANRSYTALNKVLEEIGFVPNTFYNASSNGKMILWTLVLHPEK